MKPPPLKFRIEHKYYDLSTIEKINYSLSNTVSNNGIKYHLGGIRKSFFGLGKINITKHPLLKFEPKISIKNDHAIENARTADFSCVIFHYKYVNNFHDYVKKSVKEENHFDNSSQYKAYLRKLNQSPHSRILSENAKEFVSLEQLIDQDFVVTSTNYMAVVLVKARLLNQIILEKYEAQKKWRAYIYSSYSWRIGHTFVTFFVLLFGWAPLIKNYLDKRHKGE